MKDMDILRNAYEKETDSRDRRHPDLRNWEAYTVRASRADIARLLEGGMIVMVVRNKATTRYKLTKEGRNLVWSTTMERQFNKIPAGSILEALDLVVGFDDVKETIAGAISARRKMNFLLEGPPACAKSIFLEGIRSSVPTAYIAFGSRTSASGLSDALFEHQPSVLLLDEADKMHMDVYSVLLGLMESGEILETKSMKTRGIQLETMVIAACNSSAKMPKEFLSRFALHLVFPTYTRAEFISVCKGFLSKAEGCEPDVAALIGKYVHDYNVGDVRKARGVWQLMNEPTETEIVRVINLMRKYSPENSSPRKKKGEATLLPGFSEE